MKNFKELIDFAKKKAPRQCVVLKAEDETVLEGIDLAQKQKLIKSVLIGDKNAIARCAQKVRLDTHDATIHDVREEEEAIKKAISIVKGEGDFLMKGMLSSSSFLKGVLNKDFGLRSGKILSHIAVLEIPGYHKLIFMSDGGMNPSLNLAVRLDIIRNAIETLHILGLEKPKIAMVAASETVNPDMPETTDAAAIVGLHKKGEMRDAIIEGPFGFDVAISKDAAQHKKIQSEIAGDVDFLLMPNISAANIWAKGLIYFAQAKAAGMVVGALKPIVMLSRADDAQTKLNSIALGVALS